LGAKRKLTRRENWRVRSVMTRCRPQADSSFLLLMSDDLIPSVHILQRTLAADISYTVSRMKVLEGISGNPVGIAYQWFDEGAVALMARLPAFCRVVGLRPGHEHHVEPLARWYAEHDIKPTFELVPGQYDQNLSRELTRLGFYQSSFHASLIGKPVADGDTNDAGAIELVTTAEALEDYLNAYVGGWGIPEKHHAQFKSNVRPSLKQAGWSLYLARVNGQPAAAATLYVHDRVGYLADSATDPSFRRRGLQVALLRRRIRDAGLAGADLVFSGAEPLSSSHRNMERVGMRLQFTRAKWTLAA
jgi:ribosomal protein S18 acetylase RimI-like enzyme